MPALDDETRADYQRFLPTRHDYSLLVDTNAEGVQHEVLRIDPFRLIQHAGRFGWTLAQAHRRASRLRPLGLIADYPADACSDHLVEWQDMLVLTQFLDGQLPLVANPVSNAHIAAAAIEVGEPAAYVVKRIRRYAPFLNLTIAGDEDGCHSA